MRTNKSRWTSAIRNLALASIVAALAAPARQAAAQLTGCADGLVSYWTFDDSGNPGRDDFGGNDGTVYGATPAPGKVGNALSFNGSYIDCGNSASLQTDTALTVELWAKPNDGFFSQLWGLVNKHMVLVNDDGSWTLRDNGQGSRQVSLWTADNLPHPTRRIYINGVEETNSSQLGEQAVAATTLLETGVWYHIVGIIEDTSGIGANDLPVGIGYMELWAGGPNYHFNGLIDEVALYNRALTPAEVASHYSRGLSGRNFCGPADSDDDGIIDADNVCPHTPAAEAGSIITFSSPWLGCGPSERDLDGDSLSDAQDRCPESRAANVPFITDHLGCMANSCDPSQLDSDHDGTLDTTDVCPWTDPRKAPASPVLEGCSCFQILQWKGGNNQWKGGDNQWKGGDNSGELKHGCTQETLKQFSTRSGWAKNVPRPPR